MKKLPIFYIILIVFAGIFILNIFFHVYYFRNLHNKVGVASESEKEKIIEILNQSLELEGNISDVKILNVYVKNNEKFAVIEFGKGRLMKSYLINLNQEKIVKR